MTPVETPTMDAAVWPLVIAAAGGAELDGTDRAALVTAGVLAADGRALEPAAAAALRGLRDVRAVVSVRTVRRSGAADLDVFLAPGSSTALERVGDRLALSAVETSVAPVRIAEQLGIGPRGVPRLAAPVRFHSGLLGALLAGDHPSVLEGVAGLVEAFAPLASAVADALEAGEWRISITQTSVADVVVAVVVLLDTPAGLFALATADEEDDLAVVPLTTGDLWRRLSAMVTLDGAVGLAARRTGAAS